MRTLDLRKLTWGTKNATGSGNGSYFQALDQSVTPTRYYKLSNFNDFDCTSMGYESFFEVIAYRLGKMLGFDVLQYHLVNGKIKVRVRNQSKLTTTTAILCYSEDFRRGGETKTSLYSWCKTNIPDNNIEAGLRSISSYINDYLDRMFVFDCLICNRDRHRGNIEVLQSKDGSYRFSPLFDHGQSFCATFGMNEIAIRNFDYTQDIWYNDGIGKGYHYKNIASNSKPVVVNRLPHDFRTKLFYGMSQYLPKYVMESVASTIEYRYRLMREKGIIIEI